MQSADPRGLADRWSKIADLPLRNDARGRIELPLDNAAVRFVEATDGRGEGLGGIDVVVADRQRLLDAAEQRGLREDCRSGRYLRHPLLFGVVAEPRLAGGPELAPAESMVFARHQALLLRRAGRISLSFVAAMI